MSNQCYHKLVRDDARHVTRSFCPSGTRPTFMTVIFRQGARPHIPETLLATANEVIEWESRNAKRLDH
jgi:hypothetical protein